MPWILPKQLTRHSEKTNSEQRNYSVSANPLPRQAEHQRLKLFGVEFNFVATVCARPMEFTLVQAARGQPDTHAVVHQYFHSIGPAIGKQISTVRLRRTEHRDHAGQRGVGTGTHIHGLGGEPDGINTDH